jgi:hypothetical protein
MASMPAIDDSGSAEKAKSESPFGREECGFDTPAYDPIIPLLQVFHQKQVRQVASVSENVVLLVGGDSRA